MFFFCKGLSEVVFEKLENVMGKGDSAGILTHSLIHHFEDVPNSKTLQMTLKCGYFEF